MKRDYGRVMNLAFTQRGFLGGSTNGTDSTGSPPKDRTALARETSGEFFLGFVR